jgi:hypothetical protein
MTTVEILEELKMIWFHKGLECGKQQEVEDARHKHVLKQHLPKEEEMLQVHCVSF